MQRRPRPADCLRLRRAAWGTTLWLCLGTAFAGSPRVHSLFPPAGQRGSEQEVTFSGGQLDDARTVLFDAPGFEITPVKKAPNLFTARIRIPADAALGEHRCRVVTESGVSDLRLFFVSPFPVIPNPPPGPEGRAGSEPAQPAKAGKRPGKSEPAPPQKLALNTTAVGRTPGKSVHTYELDLEKGRPLSVEVVGLQLSGQNPFDPEVTVFKPDHSVLQSVSSTVFGRGNPVFSIEVPETGAYRLTINDSTGDGQGECQYILHIGDFPRPLAALPAGAPPGTASAFELLGDLRGALSANASPGALENTIGGVFPAGNRTTPPSPVPVRVSSLPNVIGENASFESAAKANKAEGPVTPLPAAFNGILKNKGEQHFYRFAAEKGKGYEFTVFGRSLRSPIDSVLSLYDEKGAHLASNDDTNGPDSFLRWSAPSDGVFLLEIRDQMKRGGPLFTYRIEAKPAAPRVSVWPAEMVNNSTQERRAIVVPQGGRFAMLLRIKREDWKGPLQLHTPELPPQIHAVSKVIDASADAVAMVFEADPDAPRTERLIPVTGSPTEGGEEPAPEVQLSFAVNLSENTSNIQRPFYAVKERLLPIAVTAPIPAKLEVSDPPAKAVRGGKFPLKLRVQRDENFKGPVEATLLHAPTGIATAGSVRIPADSAEGELNLSISPDAPLKKWPLCVTANADFGSGPVWFSSGLFEVEVGEAPFAGTLLRSSISQGGTASVRMKLEHKSPFEGKAKVELQGLPNGVTSEPREVDSQTPEVVFPITATAGAALGVHKQLSAQATLSEGGIPLTSNCATGGILRVDRAAPSPQSPP